MSKEHGPKNSENEKRESLLARVRAAVGDLARRGAASPQVVDTESFKPTDTYIIPVTVLPRKDKNGLVVGAFEPDGGVKPQPIDSAHAVPLRIGESGYSLDEAATGGEPGIRSEVPPAADMITGVPTHQPVIGEVASGVVQPDLITSVPGFDGDSGYKDPN